jgi:hypothetical protein
MIRRNKVEARSRESRKDVKFRLSTVLPPLKAHLFTDSAYSTYPCAAFVGLEENAPPFIGLQ